MAVAIFPIHARARRRLGVIGAIDIGFDSSGTGDLDSLGPAAQNAVVGAVQDGLAQGFEVLGKIAASVAGGAAAGLVAAGSAGVASVSSALGLTAATVSILPGVGIAAGAIIGAVAVIAEIGVMPGPSPPPNLDDAGWDTLGGSGLLSSLLSHPESALHFVTSTSTPISVMQAVPVLRTASTIGAWALQHVADINSADITPDQGAAAVLLWQSNWPAIWSVLVNKEQPVVPGGLYDAILKTTGFDTINSRLFANALARCLGAPENGQPYPPPAPPPAPPSLLSNVAAPPAPPPINPATGLPYQNGYSPSNPPPVEVAKGWGGPITLQPGLYWGVSSAPVVPAKAAAPKAAPAAGLSTGSKVALGAVATSAAGVVAAQALGVNVLGWIGNALSLKDLLGMLRK